MRAAKLMFGITSAYVTRGPATATSYTPTGSDLYGPDATKDELVMDYGITGRDPRYRSASTGWSSYTDGLASGGIPAPTTGNYAFNAVVTSHPWGSTTTEFPSADVSAASYASANANVTFSFWHGRVFKETNTAGTPGNFFDRWPLPAEWIPRRLRGTPTSIFPQPFFSFKNCSPGCTEPQIIGAEHYESAGALFASGLVNTLGQRGGDRWVPAAEPPRFATGETPSYAAVSPDGTTVNLVLGISGNVLAPVSISYPAFKPSARSNFGVVLSQEQNAVYVIGGVNSQQQNTNELWKFSIATSTWTNVGISATTKPSKVLAATYSPSEDRLLVLDQSGSTVRLLRMSLNGATVTTLGSWSRTLSNTTFGIVTTNDASKYAVACTDSAGGHTVLRFTRSPNGATLSHYANGAGALVSGLLNVRDSGISVLTLKDSNWLPRGYYIDDFTTVSDSNTAKRCF